MEDTSKWKTYLAGALFLTIGEIILILAGQAKLPISGLVLFGAFLALSIAVKHTQRFKGLSFTFLILGKCSRPNIFKCLRLDRPFKSVVLVLLQINRTCKRCRGTAGSDRQG